MTQSPGRSDIARIKTGLIVEALACLYLLVVVVLFWRRPAVSSLLLSVAIGYWIWRYRDKTDIAAMLAAALLGVPAEMLCVRYGIWTYHAPGLFLGIPVWIPLVWASLFCLFRRITLSLLDAVHRIWENRTPGVSKVLTNAGGVGILVYFVVLVATISRPIVIVYSVFMLIGIVFWRRERDILMFVVGGILGTLGEFVCMQLGFWHYHFPYLQSLGLPISLPMAWGISAVIIGRIARIWEAG